MAHASPGIATLDPSQSEAMTDEALPQRLALRLSEADHAALAAVAARFPGLKAAVVARAAFRAGLAALARDPALIGAPAPVLAAPPPAVDAPPPAPAAKPRRPRRQ